MSHAWQLVALAALLIAGPSAAQDSANPAPICGRPEVLGVVAEDIARRGVSAVIIPGDFGEIPTNRPGTVRCAIRLRTTYLDTNRFGFVPQQVLSTAEFMVRSGQNGLFVDPVSFVDAVSLRP